PRRFFSAAACINAVRRALAAKARADLATDGRLLPRGSALAGRPVSASSRRWRQTTRILPMCCTGAASSCEQRSFISTSRASRSAPWTLILMSSCACSERSISPSTAGVRPFPAMVTTGFRWCAVARNSRRCAGVSSIIFFLRQLRAEFYSDEAHPDQQRLDDGTRYRPLGATRQGGRLSLACRLQADRDRRARPAAQAGCGGGRSG